MGHDPRRFWSAYHRVANIRRQGEALAPASRATALAVFAIAARDQQAPLECDNPLVRALAKELSSAIVEARLAVEGESQTDCGATETDRRTDFQNLIELLESIREDEARAAASNMSTNSMVAH